MRSVTIVYRAGRENLSADALSRSPYTPAPSQGIAHDEVQVSSVAANGDLLALLRANPLTGDKNGDDYSADQSKDPDLGKMVDYLKDGKLPENPDDAKRLVAQESQFSIIDGTLFFVEHRHKSRKRVAVPRHLRDCLLQENHKGNYSDHFSGPKLYNALARHWW